MRLRCDGRLATTWDAWLELGETFGLKCCELGVLGKSSSASHCLELSAQLQRYPEQLVRFRAQGVNSRALDSVSWQDCHLYRCK